MLSGGGTLSGKRLALLRALERSGAIDTSAVRKAFIATDRACFVADSRSHCAYEDTALSIGCDQTISQPAVVAAMTEALRPDERARVLEIGTGSGYQTMILSHVFGEVYSLERHRVLHDQACARLGSRSNVRLRCSEGLRGWESAAPFDRILVTAASPTIPSALLAQLRNEGIMVMPLGSANGDQDLCRIVKKGKSRREVERLFAVRFVPLVCLEMEQKS